MLDRIYDGDIGQRWTASVREGIGQFEERVLASLRPFATDESIEDLFDRLFDGVEVLPETEEAEYIRRRDEQPLLAPSVN